MGSRSGTLGQPGLCRRAPTGSGAHPPSRCRPRSGARSPAPSTCRRTPRSARNRPCAPVPARPWMPCSPNPTAPSRAGAPTSPTPAGPRSPPPTATPAPPGPRRRKPLNKPGVKPDPRNRPPATRTRHRAAARRQPRAAARRPDLGGRRPRRRAAGPLRRPRRSDDPPVPGGHRPHHAEPAIVGTDPRPHRARLPAKRRTGSRGSHRPRQPTACRSSAGPATPTGSSRSAARTGPSSTSQAWQCTPRSPRPPSNCVRPPPVSAVPCTGDNPDPAVRVPLQSGNPDVVVQPGPAFFVDSLRLETAVAAPSPVRTTPDVGDWSANHRVLDTPASEQDQTRRGARERQRRLARHRPRRHRPRPRHGRRLAAGLAAAGRDRRADHPRLPHRQVVPPRHLRRPGVTASAVRVGVVASAKAAIPAPPRDRGEAASPVSSACARPEPSWPGRRDWW